MNGKSIALAIAISGIGIPVLAACTTTAAVNADIAHELESATRISAGMSRLGASPERSECFADKIAAALSAPDAYEAVQLVEASASKEEMRSGVLGASTSVKQSFIRANFGCSFFQ